jgi:hypothetical protein
MNRPAPVTVFAVLCMVFGAIGLLGLAFSAVVLFLVDLPEDPINAAMRNSPAYMTYLKISIPIQFAASVFLFVCGVGLLRLREWARKAAVGYAIFGLASALVNLGLSLAVVYWPALRQMSGSRGSDQAVLFGTIIGSIFGLLLALAFPILLLVVMTRPSVRRAFESGCRPPPVL